MKRDAVTQSNYIFLPAFLRSLVRCMLISFKYISRICALNPLLVDGRLDFSLRLGIVVVVPRVLPGHDFLIFYRPYRHAISLRPRLLTGMALAPLVG